MFNKTFKVILNNKIKPFKKVINVDADKSISIRSLIVGSISHNISYVSNILESEDVISTINCLKKLGVKIYKKKNLYYIY
jgi:3-phosphoshikimate 1-carboxyvinyltransferase